MGSSLVASKVHQRKRPEDGVKSELDAKDDLFSNDAKSPGEDFDLDHVVSIAYITLTASQFLHPLLSFPPRPTPEAFSCCTLPLSKLSKPTSTPCNNLEQSAYLIDSHSTQYLNFALFGFINPARIVEQGKTSTLADDVVGRIDMTTNFFGKEMNNTSMGSSSQAPEQIPHSSFPLLPEQFHRPWLSNSLSHSLASSPISSSRLNLTLPLQIDVIVRFDDETMKVTSYDATLRRWSEFWDYFIPFLVPKAAEELMAANTAGVDYANSTDIVVHRAAADIYTVAQTYCVGDSKQYDSYGQCIEFLTKKVPFGAA
ncbi:uncharacterized protein ARMOST_11171 [Armillaria ostoyae]|uniref:Uncharacterized protein n=1 Tax=Armillaria ostoyae TaxID=47428 RepID=A0A284RGE2_ARMOS|nr:uncharacterized protein ARMOST_11171 [Armillaria ostoyae]